MRRLYLITGLGHCGTAWLAHVLNHQDQGVYAIHEGVKVWTKRPWKEAVLHYLDHGVDSYFDLYFNRLSQAAHDFSYVIDSHSWIPTAVPEVQQKVRVTRIIHLVRNGLKNVTSLYETFNEVGGEWEGKGSWFEGIIKRELAVIGGQTLKDPFSWEGWCHLWALNQKTVSWMRAHDFRVGVLPLEVLVRGQNVLTSLLNSFGVEADQDWLMEQQKTVMNPHVESRTSRTIWNGLSDIQRNTFTEICGEAMRYYGYEIDDS
jgi:hypothetical protein